MTSMASLPKKLHKEPIIEVVFEMRFKAEAEVPASNVLSGIFFTKYKTLKMEKLPISDIPQQIRDSDPGLRYAPQLRMIFENYALLVGDRMFATVALLPYPGWTNFKKQILEFVAIVKDSNIISEIERYSLKYVNLISAPSIKEQLERIKLNLKVGSHQIENEAVNIRVEIPKDNFINIVQIISRGIIAGKEEGVIINIDSIANGPCNSFWNSLSDNLEQAHNTGKTLFFDFLQEKTLKLLEPVYDE